MRRTPAAVVAILLCVLPFLPSQAAERPKGGTRGGHHGGDHREMKSAPGAATAPVEAQFLDTMIAHHEAAVDMAKLVKTRSAHTELIEMAARMFQSQRREIDQMRAWRQRWFKAVPRALNMDLPGMKDSMGGMDLEKLKRAQGKDFDLLFLQQMIPHHQGAIRMSETIREQTSRRELKELADRIIREQQREVEQMTQWQSAWPQSVLPSAPLPSDAYLALATDD